MTPEPGSAGAEPARALLLQYREVWALLTRPLRLLAITLLAGTVIGAALEVLGLSLLAALISAITPGSAGPPGWMQSLDRLLGVGRGADPLRLVAFCALVFAAKNVFMGGLAWLESTFAFRLQTYVADAALAAMLRADYEEVTRRPAAEHLNLITADLTVLIFHVALPTLTLVSEALLMLGVVGFLLWAEPALTGAVVLVVGAAALILMRWSRRTIARLGVRRQQIEDERMRRLREIFGHLREVYVYRAGSQALAQTRGGLEQLAGVYRTYTILATGPRFVLELVLVAVLLAAVVIGLRGDGRGALIVSVSLFAASGFRLLIGANRLIMSAQGIRFGQAALTRIVGAIRGAPGAAPPALAGAAPAQARVLALEDVSYVYPGAAAPVLEHVSLAVTRGRLIGIRGGSGRGKTTLLEVLAGLRRARSGRLLLDGRAIADPAGALFHLVGYVGQVPAIFSDSVRRNVAYGYPDAEIDDARVWSALERAHLAGFVRSLPQGLDHALGGSVINLSGGQAQRVALARALYAQCSFLLLDEPTSALDPATEEDVVRTLVELAGECGILLVSHRPRPLEACDAVYELHAGGLQLATAAQAEDVPNL